MSWAQQRERIRRAGGQAKDLGAGLSDSAPRRAGRAVGAAHAPQRRPDARRQLYYQLAGRRPPSRQFDEAQPLIREAQVARNVRQAVLGNPAEDDAIMELSEEVYFLDGSREWTLSSQTTQRLDDRTVVETSLRQPLTALAQREVSYQLFKGDEEVLSDFDAICDRGWQERGITPEEIRWRGAAEKEARAVAFTAWQGHAFFYKNARSVYQCDDAEGLRPRFRSERRESGLPEFAQWQEWDGDLRAARGALMAAEQGGHAQPLRVAQPG
ncbi:pfh1, partial [Symbiodinium pilosum]